METQFEKLEELVKDEKKIVTVASYAFSSDITFNESLKAVNKYVEVNSGSDVHSTYVLNGIDKATGGISIVQVKDESLNNEKQLFKNNPLQMVYSVQKAKDLDYNIISLVGEEIKDFALLGAITGNNCIKRKLCKKSLPPLPPAANKTKHSLFTKPSSSKSSVVDEIKSNEKSQPAEADSKPKASSKSNSITNLFNKAAKTDSKPKLVEKKQQQNGRLSGFLTKQTNKETIKEETVKKAKEENSSSDSKNKKSDLFDSDTDDEILKDLKIHETSELPKKQTSLNQSKPTKVSSQNNKPRPKKAEKILKKRKRIVIDESDSDDILGSEESDKEEIIPMEEEPQSKPEPKPLAPKNKRRKAVNKTYEDDQGFIVTQTEYVYETASEDENEPQPKIAKKEPLKPKVEKQNVTENEVSPNKGTKNKKTGKKAPVTNQPTLMNFFQKK